MRDAIIMEQNSPSEALRLFEEAWNEARAAFVASHDDFAEKLASTRQTLRSCAGNIEKHKANFDQLSEATAARFEEVRALVAANAGNAEAEEKLAAAEAKLSEQEAALAEKERALETALAEVKVAQGGAAAAEERAAALATEIEELKAAGAAQDSLREELEALRSSEAEAKGALAAATSEAEQARKRLEEAEHSLTELEKETGPLKELLAAAQSEADTAKADAEAAMAERDKTKQELDKANSELEGLQRQASAADAAQSSTQDELEQLRESVRNAESATASVQEVLNATGAELQTAKAELDAERRRAEMAEQKLKDEMAKGTKASLAAQLAEAIQEAEDAKAELRQLKINVSGASSGTATGSASGGGTAARSPKDELKALLDSIKQVRGQKRTIGELLVNAELLTNDQVAQAMDEQRKRPQTHLGTILIEKNWVSEEAVALALAHQCGSNYVELSDGKVDPEAATLITERLANQHVCIPMHVSEDAVTVAMANPMDLVAIEDVERATGRKVEVMVSTGTKIREAIAKYYWEP